MIHQARRGLRLTQPEFGELIGVSYASVWQWESGRRIPKTTNWRLMCMILNAKGIKFDAAGNCVFTPFIAGPSLDIAQKTA